jgi:hypothetical protein
MAGTWKLITNQPPASVDTMLLLTDGTVLAHELNSPNWHPLTPNLFGDYENGTWSPTIVQMPPNPAIPAAQKGPAYGPLFFGSAVLKDGTVLVIGGEYNMGSGPYDLAAATLYDPVANNWTNLTTPPGWTNVGDVPLCVMPDGRVLLGNINSNQTAFFDPATKSYTVGPNKNDRCAEESFTLMPDETVMAVECTAIPHAEKYLASSNSWVSAGTTPSTLPQTCPILNIVPEIGPSVLLATGQLFVIGATGNTALYWPPSVPSQPGTWTAGPTLKDGSGNTIHPIDAPAVLLPNGKVLLAGSPAPPCNFPPPTVFFEYDPAANTATLVPSPTNATRACFKGRLLTVPSGKVLFSNQSGTVAVYTPDGAPNNTWRPVIVSCPTALEPGHGYVISGHQFNGLSQACSYGDDATMATNYPLVRLTNNSTGAARFCRTANHSTMAVATGSAIVSTTFTVPTGLPSGSYSLAVIANGIASANYSVTVISKLVKEIKDIKEHKLEKLEFKEHKLEKFEKIEIKEIEQKLVNETKLKDAETIEQQVGGGDPALMAALQDLHTRIAVLSEAVQQQQRAAISPEERPEVGEAALQHSRKKLQE